MPLKQGSENIGYNIKELEATGRGKDQALAIALKTAGKTKVRKQKRKGTAVGAENP
jgi:hypothetical protein